MSEPNDSEKAAQFLDRLSGMKLDTFEGAYLVRIVMEILPRVEWAKQLRWAYERQESADDDDNSMRLLAQLMAPELLGYTS